MSRAFFNGFVVGGVVAIGAAVGTSLSVDMPSAPRVLADAPVSTAAPANGTGHRVATSDVSESRPTGGAVQIDTPAAVPPSAAAATETPAKPDVYMTDAAPELSAEPETAPSDVLIAAIRNGETPRLDAPEPPRSDLAAGTPPRTPEVSSGPRIAPEDVAVALPEAPAPAQTALDPPASMSDRADKPAVPARPSQTPEPAQIDRPVAAVTPPPAPAATPAAPRAAPVVRDPPQTAVEEESAPSSEGRPRIGRLATSLIDRETSPNPAEAPPETAPTKTDMPALDAFAVAYDNAGNLPLMSIVLMDARTGPHGEVIDLKTLTDFPYPVTFAVNTGLPDAAERAAWYRAQGFEVLAMVDLPATLNASDTEVALSVALDAVPGAVGLMEGTATGLQGNRNISDQIRDILADTGHGIVWQPNGLDTAQKLAARAGVASETLFRDFDGAGQGPDTIRRFLDQAAFRAGQQGSVIMVGRLQPDTISALLVWGLQNRAQRVAVAPVSAVLKAGRGAEDS